MDNPFASYYVAKRRDLPCAVDSASDQLRALDSAVVASLFHRGDPTPEERTAIDDAFEAVLTAPGSRWTRDTLAYRLRVLHFA